jgi:hypothetical protein
MSRLFVVLVGLMVLPAAEVVAQVTIPAPRHHGLWVGGGVGYAATKLSCGLCGEEGSRIGGLSGYLRAGYTLTPSFLMGVEIDAWGGSAEPEDPDNDTVGRFMGSVMAVGYWYPSTRMGLFLKAGAGMVSYRADGDFLTVGSFGGTVGAGFEVPVADNLSVVPFVNYLDSANGELKLDGEPIGQDGSVSMWQLGVGATWH